MLSLGLDKSEYWARRSEGVTVDQMHVGSSHDNPVMLNIKFWLKQSKFW